MFRTISKLSSVSLQFRLSAAIKLEFCSFLNSCEPAVSKAWNVTDGRRTLAGRTSAHMARAAVAAPPEVTLSTVSCWEVLYGRLLLTAAEALCSTTQVEPTSNLARSEHGFELVKQQYVAEYDSDVRLYRHQKTGQHLP